MEGESQQPRNEKRAFWRSKCRNRLSRHIEENLGINVKPSEVRLNTNQTDIPYLWQVDDPSLKPLFEKHLSKHSVGAYMQLYQEVEKSFRAVPLLREKEARIETSPEQLHDENSRLRDELQQVRNQVIVETRDKTVVQDEVRGLQSTIREMQMTVYLLQQEIQQWVAVVQYYEVHSTKYVSGLDQAIIFLDSLKSAVSMTSGDQA